MAICRVNSPPDLFFTFTCNTKWREIADALRCEPGQQPCDLSDLIVCMFHMKVNGLIKYIREGTIFGAVPAVLHTVEFQKHGLPLIPCLVWLVDARSEFSAFVPDGSVCTKIPNIGGFSDSNRVTKDLTFVPTANAPGHSSTRTQKSTTKKAQSRMHEQ